VFRRGSNAPEHTLASERRTLRRVCGKSRVRGDGGNKILRASRRSRWLYVPLMAQHRFKVGDLVRIAGSASANLGETFMDALVLQPGFMLVPSAGAQ